jgi:ATP-binding cassette subfamily B protein
MVQSRDVGSKSSQDLGSDPDAKVAGRDLPRHVRTALATTWHAAPAGLVVSLVLTAVRGIGLGVELLIARGALNALFVALRTDGSVSLVAPWAVALGVGASLLLFASALQREHDELLGERTARHIEGRILDVAGTVDLVCFEDPAFHNHLQRAQMSRDMPLRLVRGLSGLISGLVGVVGVIAAIVTIAPMLTVLIVLVPIPAWLAASRRANRFYRLFWRLTGADRERFYLAGLLSDRFSAAEVRAFDLAGFLRHRYDELYAGRIDHLRDAMRRQLLYSFVTNLVVGAMVGAAMFLVGWLSLSGRVQATDAGVIVAGLGMVGARLAEAGHAAGELSEAGLYVDDCRDLLDSMGTAGARRDGCSPSAGFSVIEVDQVSFTYPGGARPAVDQVSLTIRRGEFVAFVGENGSGKTTLARLLGNLYLPTTGTIAWDGVPASGTDDGSIRGRVAIMTQDFVQFHLPVRDNVGIGRTEAIDDVDRLRRAVVQAGAQSVVAGLSLGYDTMLGPEFLGGTDLSRGQWQQLVLARVLFRDAQLVVLDEPSAALDARAEADLFERIQRLRGDKTIVLISHRLASVRRADRIYVLEEGRVVEVGNHAELSARRGRYAELFERQSSLYAPAGT